MGLSVAPDVIRTIHTHICIFFPVRINSPKNHPDQDNFINIRIIFLSIELSNTHSQLYWY